MHAMRPLGAPTLARGPPTLAGVDQGRSLPIPGRILAPAAPPRERELALASLLGSPAQRAPLHRHAAAAPPGSPACASAQLGRHTVVRAPLGGEQGRRWDGDGIDGAG
jgi:hypothetical protein